MKTIQLILIALAFIFSLSGCASKEPVIKEITVTKNVYIKQKPYTFQKIELNGLYLEAGNKELQRKCTPIVLEVSKMYKGVIGFYDWQIDDYNKKKGVDNNESGKNKRKN